MGYVSTERQAHYPCVMAKEPFNFRDFKTHRLSMGFCGWTKWSAGYRRGNAMKPPTLDDLKEMVRQAGYTPSCGSWQDDVCIHAFSAESHGAATYGHSKFAAHYRKHSGWLTVTGQPDRNLLEP